MDLIVYHSHNSTGSCLIDTTPGSNVPSKSILWSTVSNAFFRSRNTIPFSFPMSIFACIPLVGYVQQCCNSRVKWSYKSVHAGNLKADCSYVINYRFGYELAFGYESE
jgi:hypothetical protein